MRFHNVISEICGSRSKARVLETLLNLPVKKWTGRQLALEAKVSQSQANLALKKLKEYGIVSSMRAGAAVVWSVNYEHILVTWLQPVASMARRIAPLLAEEIGKTTDLRKVDKIILFGSVARGEERPTSDIDVLVVVKNASDKKQVLKQVLDASAKLLGMFGGNPLLPLVYSKQEAKQKNKSALMREIERDKIIAYDGELE